LLPVFAALLAWEAFKALFRAWLALLKWDWFMAVWVMRYETFDLRLSWHPVLKSYRRWLDKLPFKWRVNKEPIKRTLTDEDGNEGNVWVQKFSEKDIRKREQFLSQPASTEETRRGRSRRGRDSTIQIQRIRQFNFEYGLYDTDFVYPDEYWDEDQKKMVPHPKAGDKVPVTREAIEEMDASVSEQVNDFLNEVNEPPAELPEIRDEEGNVIEEAVETPTVLNSAAS
jgi:hypothetical protein